MAKIWGIAPWQGRSLVEDKTVMDQYKEEAKPKSTEYKNTEPAFEGAGLPTLNIGDLQLGISDLIGPGALGKAGVAIKGALTGGSALMVGAFRSSATTMLPRKTVDFLETAKPTNWYNRSLVPNDEQHLAAMRNADPEQYIELLLGQKTTSKELAKYGDETFVLDPFLGSTRSGRDIANSPITVEQLVDNETHKTLMAYNESRAIMHRTITNSDNETKAINGIDSMLSRNILQSGTLVEDYMLAGKNRKTLLRIDRLDAKDDIKDGYRNLLSDIYRHAIPVEDIEGKSLHQIVSLVNKKNDEIIKVLKKSQIAVDRKVAERTLELKYQRPELGDWVELTDLRDLSQETAKMNHCIGSVGMDNNKHIPALDTITGVAKLDSKDSYMATSAYEYQERLERGESKYFSFRPKGLPEVTVEVIEDNGYKSAVQAFGKKDVDLTLEQQKEYWSFIDKLGVDDRTKYKKKRPAQEVQNTYQGLDNQGLLDRLGQAGMFDN